MLMNSDGERRARMLRISARSETPCWRYASCLSLYGVSEKKVLVVDDDELIRWGLVRELSSLSLDVEAVSTAVAAVERIGQQAYRLVFVDIHLPDADGLDLIPRIRTTSPETEIVVISSDTTNANKRRAFAEGASQFIDKPFDLSEITRLARSAFGTFTEKRLSPRFFCRLRLRFEIEVAGAPGADFSVGIRDGTVLDVGSGGLRLKTACPLESEQRIRTLMVDRNDPCSKYVPQKALARVIWVAPDAHGITAGLRYC